MRSLARLRRAVAFADACRGSPPCRPPDAYPAASAPVRHNLYGWLAERGFQVPANSHANCRATDFSLAATLNMQYLDNLTRQEDIVAHLLAGLEPTRPIVIIEGDEGPLMCQSTDCVMNKPEYLRIPLGNLVAMYLPGVDEVLPDTFTPVNTFRIVFRDYFAAELEPLPDRSFTWPNNEHLYDFRDVTDEILASGE
jgi:hypothetical protein